MPPSHTQTATQVFLPIRVHSYVRLLVIITIIEITEPGPVSQLVTQSISESSVNISWSLPQQQNGIILFYEVAVNGLYNETHNSSVFSTMIDGLSKYSISTCML